MINAFGDKECRFGSIDAIAGGYLAPFVVCYGKMYQVPRAGASSRSLVQPPHRPKVLMLPNPDWKIVRFHLAGPPP